ncbi:MAG TPA: hypothetical protein VML75_08115 [Kofleriaceae bacterium]|nr:hypothetical protein [Kofleriaceae bacterium]
MSRWLAVVVFVAGCSSSPPGITVHVGAGERAALEEFAAHIPYAQLSVSEAADPAAAAAGGGAAIDIAVVADLDCTECYRIERVGDALIVHGDAPLGVQYGLAHAFELLGFRFYHPWDTRVPSSPALPAVDAVGLGETFEPDVAVRGLHLHTIHPIEGYYAFWQPGEENLADARRIIDWTVKNRGNYLQWVALDDLVTVPGAAEPWRAHTAAILESARARGLRVGLAIQLFGASNLQQGFDLVDAEDELVTPEDEMRARYPVILDGLRWDNINLSFGEFFGADPALFIDTVNTAWNVLDELAPGTEMAATVHVGDTEGTRVDYMGENLIYYFLVKFCDAAIRPWIHTVMYYNLLDDAGGAYHHDDFAEHRAYLLERIEAGQPVGYFPETAYWVAFDNSVPVYLPLYVESRFRDLQAHVPVGLDEHVLFSSGWEWGYWQNDYASLRMSYTVPTDIGVVFDEMFAPLPKGAELARVTTEMAADQHQGLIVDRLAAYMAGRDVYIDVGRQLDIISQPDRVLFEEAAAMDPTGRAAFASSVLDGLDALAVQTRGHLATLRGLGNDPWIAEVRDGTEVSAARLEFIAAAYRAVLASAGGENADAELAAMEAALATGAEVIARRVGAMHHPRPLQIASDNPNATIYQFGYLKMGHDLCYWNRERAQVRNLVLGTTEAVPPCVF